MSHGTYKGCTGFQKCADAGLVIDFMPNSTSPFHQNCQWGKLIRLPWKSAMNCCTSCPIYRMSPFTLTHRMFPANSITRSKNILIADCHLIHTNENGSQASTSASSALSLECYHPCCPREPIGRR